MKIQSISVVVPAWADDGNCVNNCRFCVSRMHNSEDKYVHHSNPPWGPAYINDCIRRLTFAHQNGCNSLLLTGTTDPQINRKFLTGFANMLNKMGNPFPLIEIQTTGTLWDDRTWEQMEWIGVSTISLSINSFDDEENFWCRGHNTRAELSEKNVYIKSFCEEIKRRGYNLRLSLNLTKWFSCMNKMEVFDWAKKFGADQLTFRKLYAQEDTSQAKWIETNGADEEWLNGLKVVVQNLPLVRRLETGVAIRAYDDMSVVYDQDCMDKTDRDDNVLRYVILRPNGKLYSSWDSKASLIF